MIFQTAVFFAAAFLQGMCIVLFPAASFIWKNPEIGALSNQQYGSAFLPQILSAIVTSVALKPLLDRVSRNLIGHTAIACNIFYACCLIAVWTVPGDASRSFVYLCLANLFLGVGFGFMIALLNIRIVETFPKKRDAMMAALHGSLGIGAATAPWLISLFYQWGIWQLAPLVLISSSALLGLAAFFSKAFGVEERAPSAPGLPEDEPSRLAFGARLFLLAAVFYGCTESITANWSVSFLHEEKNFSVTVAAAALSAFWFALTAGRLLATLAVAKISSRFLYRTSPFIVLAGLSALIWAVNEKNAVMVLSVIGFGCSYFFPMTISLSTRYYDESRESLSSLMMAAIMTGVGIGSCAVGFMKQSGWMTLQQAFLAAMFSAVGFGVLAFSLTRNR